MPVSLRTPLLWTLFSVQSASVLALDIYALTVSRFIQQAKTSRYPAGMHKLHIDKEEDKVMAFLSECETYLPFSSICDEFVLQCV